MKHHYEQTKSVSCKQSIGMYLESINNIHFSFKSDSVFICPQISIKTTVAEACIVN